MSFLKRLFYSSSHPAAKPSAATPPASPRPAESQTELATGLIVRGLIPVTPSNSSRVVAMARKNVWVADDPDMTAILEGDDRFVPCDNPHNPIFTKTPGGDLRRIRLWTQMVDGAPSSDPENMVAIISEVLTGADGIMIELDPTLILRGKRAGYILIARMSCCGADSFTVQIALSTKTADLNHVLDSNPTGVQKGKGGDLLSRVLHVASSENDLQYLAAMHTIVSNGNCTISQAPRNADAPIFN